MLVEDECRGGTVKCLLCGQAMATEGSKGPDANPRSSAMTPPTPAGGNQEIRICAHCHVKLRVPVGTQQVRCPKCQKVS